MILSKTVRHKAKNFHISRFFTESAIEAMEEACHTGAVDRKPCEDAISRRAVLDTLDKMDSVLDEDRTVETYKELLAACYNDLPSVTPARKKGKWIDTTEISTNKRGQIVHEVICSECNGISYFRSMGNKYIGANLCPNCRAEMESEE